MSIRVGVLGAGFMGRTHVDIYQRNPCVKSVCVFYFNPRRATDSGGGNIGDVREKRLDLKSMKIHDTPQELLNDPNVDLVDICLPTHLHAEYAIKALRADKHVLCEKPMTVSLKEAQAVVNTAKKARGFLMPAHCLRFWPEWAWLKEAVDSGRYGKVQSAVFKRLGSAPDWSSKSWILNPKLSGSALFDLHIHDTDFVRYLFGDPRAVFSAGSGGKATRGGIDHVVTNYLYKDANLLVSAEGGWDADASYGFTMRYVVVFERATADFDLAREGKTLLLHLPGEKTPRTVKTPPGNGWELEIAYFLDCIARGTPPKIVTAQDARDSIALIHKELKSIQTRKVVRC